MSDAARQLTPPFSLSRQWQFPLLFLSILLLATSAVRLVRAIPKPAPVDPVEVVRRLVQDAKFSEGYAQAQTTLKTAGLQKVQKAELHRLAGRCVYSIERKLAKHLPENGTRVVDAFKAAVAAGAKLDAVERLWIAEAWTWLGRSEQAAASYEEAIAAGVTGASGIRRLIVSLLEKAGPEHAQDIARQVTGILADERASAEDVFWAFGRQIEPLLNKAGVAKAMALIDETEPRLAGSPFRHHMGYERARCMVVRDQHDEADRLLRELLNGPGPKDDLWARSALLFAELQHRDGRPEAALSVYDELQRLFPTGPRFAEGLAGRGECLVTLERFDEAVAVFERLVEKAGAGGDVLRARLTTLAEQTTAVGRPDAALVLTRLALRLVASGREAQRLVYEAAIGEISLQLASRATKGETRNEHFRAAGEAFVGLSQSELTGEAEAATAMWRGIEAFDAAGDSRRTMRLLEQFVRQRLMDERRPKGLLRLGELRQAGGALRDAAAAFAELRLQYPRTQESLHAVVKEAWCLSQLDEESGNKAEQLLKRMVEPSPEEPPLFDPRAPEYAEAQFRLGEMYATRGRFEDAIHRMELLLQLPVSEQVSTTQARFLLADCYRRSGRALATEGAGHRNAEMRAKIIAEARARVLKAADLYAENIAAVQARVETLPAIEQAQYRAAWLSRGDCLFDVGRLEESRAVYSEAAWRFDGEYAGLVGLLGVTHCQRRAGQMQAARSTLARMKVLCRRMPDAVFAGEPAGMSKVEWRSRIEQMASVSGL